MDAEWELKEKENLRYMLKDDDWSSHIIECREVLSDVGEYIVCYDFVCLNSYSMYELVDFCKQCFVDGVNYIDVIARNHGISEALDCMKECVFLQTPSNKMQFTKIVDSFDDAKKLIEDYKAHISSGSPYAFNTGR